MSTSPERSASRDRTQETTNTQQHHFLSETTFTTTTTTGATAQHHFNFVADATGLVNEHSAHPTADPTPVVLTATAAATLKGQHDDNDDPLDFTGGDLATEITEFANGVHKAMSGVHIAAIRSTIEQASNLVNGAVTGEQDGRVDAEDNDADVNMTAAPTQARDQFAVGLLKTSLDQQKALLRASDAAVRMERAHVRLAASEATTRSVVAAAAQIAEKTARNTDQSDAVKTAMISKTAGLENTAKSLAEFVARSVQMTSEETISSAKTRTALDFRAVQQEVEINKLTAKNDVSQELLRRSDVRINELLNMLKILSDERDELGELPRMLHQVRKINHQLESHLNLEGIASAVVKEHEATIRRNEEARKITFESGDETTTTSTSTAVGTAKKSLRPLLNSFPIYPSPINLPSNLSLVKASELNTTASAMKRFGPDLVALKIVHKQKLTISELVHDWETKYHEVAQLKKVVEESEKARLDVCVQMSACLAALTEERRRRKMEEQFNQKMTLERAGGVTGRLHAVRNPTIATTARTLANNGAPPLFYRDSINASGVAQQQTSSTVPTGDMRAVPSHASSELFRSVPFDAEESAHTISCLHERLNNAHDEIVAFQARVAELFEQRKILSTRCDSAETKVHRLEEEHRCSQLVASVDAAKSEYIKDRVRLHQLLLDTKERVLHGASTNQALQTRLDEVSERVQSSEELVHQLTSNLDAAIANSSNLEKSVVELQNENARLWEQISSVSNNVQSVFPPTAKLDAWGGGSATNHATNVDDHVSSVSAVLDSLKNLSADGLHKAIQSQKEARIYQQHAATTGSTATSSIKEEEKAMLRGVLDVVFAQLRSSDKIRMDMNDALGGDLELQQHLLSELVEVKSERDGCNLIIQKLGALIAKYSLNVTEAILIDDEGLVGSAGASAALRTLHNAIAQNRSDDETVLSVKLGDAACTDAVRSIASNLHNSAASGGETSSSDVDPQHYRAVLRAEEMSALQGQLEQLKQKERLFERERHDLEHNLAMSEQELNMKDFWLNQVQTQLAKTEENSKLLRRENAELSQLLREQMQFASSQKYVADGLATRNKPDDTSSSSCSSWSESEDEICQNVDGENEQEDEGGASVTPDTQCDGAVDAEDAEKGYYFQDAPATAEEEEQAENDGEADNATLTTTAESTTVVKTKKKSSSTLRKPKSEASRQRRRLQSSLKTVQDLLSNTISLGVFTTNLVVKGDDNDAERGDDDDTASYNELGQQQARVSHLVAFQKNTTAALSDLTAQLRQCVNAATATANSPSTTINVIGDDSEMLLPRDPSSGADAAIQRHEQREKDRIIKEAFNDLRNTPVFKEALEEATKGWRDREAAYTAERDTRNAMIDRMMALNKDLVAKQKASNGDITSMKEAVSAAAVKIQELQAAMASAKAEYAAEKSRYEAIIATRAPATQPTNTVSATSKQVSAPSAVFAAPPATQQNQLGWPTATNLSGKGSTFVSSTSKAEIAESSTTTISTSKMSAFVSSAAVAVNVAEDSADNDHTSTATPAPLKTVPVPVVEEVAEEEVTSPSPPTSDNQPTIATKAGSAEQDEEQDEEEEDSTNPFAFGGSPFEAIVSRGSTTSAFAKVPAKAAAPTSTFTPVVIAPPAAVTAKKTPSVVVGGGGAKTAVAPVAVPAKKEVAKIASAPAKSAPKAALAPKSAPVTSVPSTAKSAALPTSSMAVLPSPPSTVEKVSPFAAALGTSSATGGFGGASSWGKTPTSFGTTTTFPAAKAPTPNTSSTSSSIVMPGFAKPQPSLAELSAVIAASGNASAAAIKQPVSTPAAVTQPPSAPVGFAAKARRNAAAAAAASASAPRPNPAAKAAGNAAAVPPGQQPPTSAWGAGPTSGASQQSFGGRTFGGRR